MDARAARRRSTDWLGRHTQRVVYALMAVALIASLTAGTLVGVFLRHAADIERQSLRTQQLAGGGIELQRLLLQAEAEGVTSKLVEARKDELESVDGVFRAVRAHDHAEGDRLRGAYLAYIRDSTADFTVLRQSGARSAVEQRRADRLLNRLESLIDVESRRLAHDTEVANPRARLAVGVGAVSVALLVALLIWQFELQRRAGRIDRDVAARSEELIRLRDEFVASVSHELRTPLTSIIGYLELLSENETGNLTEQQKTFLAIVQRSTHRLRQLVGDLLLVAEAEREVLALDVHAVDLGALAADCVEAAQPLADAEGVDLKLNRGQGVEIDGDPVRLAQMMDNLVSNAIKFTPAGGSVVVRTGREDGQALFEVRDTGPGIAAADQEHLFDRFFRARSAIDKAVRGTGLGLTITKAIVDAHKGSITVESTPGQETTFLVLLPRARALQ